METLLIVSIFILVIGFILKLITRLSDFRIRLNEKNSFLFLLGWITLGFIAKLDYSDAWGCIIIIKPILEPRNILFSIISFGLIFLAFNTKNQKLKKILSFTELIYWITKLVIFKGGYAVGFGGIPDITIVFYDLVSILLRFFLIFQIIKVDRFKFLKIALLSLLVLGIKIEVFATPIYNTQNHLFYTQNNNK